MKQLLRITYAIIFCALFTTTAHAQSWTWAKNSIGTGSEEGWDVATDDSGNVYITGYLQSPFTVFGSDTVFISGSSDMFLVKYDGSGNVLWAKRAGGSASDYGLGVATDHFGHVYVTGNFQSATATFGSVTLTCSGGDAIFLAQYDANGNVLWAKSSTTTSSGSCAGYSVATDQFGNAFVSGFFNAANVSFGSVTLTGAGGTDAFIVKYDSSGTALWAKTPNATGFDRGMDVATDTMGNVFMVGHYNANSIHFGSITLNNAHPGADNVFVVKYDGAGNALWAKSSQAAGSNYGWGVATDRTGNCFIAGRYSYAPIIVFNTDTLYNTSASQDAEVFIVKYNASGSVLWAKNGTGAGTDFAFGVATDSIGNVFVTGGYSQQSAHSISFGALTLPFPAGADDPMYIVEYDKGGIPVCATSLASGGDDNSSISINRAGEIYVGGDYEVNPFIVGADTLIQTGGENVFVAKYIPCSTITSVIAFGNPEKTNIYPNPSNGIFTLDLGEMNFTNVEIIITDVLGNIIYQSKINDAQTQLDLAGHSTGIYFYKISNTTKIIATGKIILQ